MTYVVEKVDPKFACPTCGEDDMDLLVWDALERITCSTCNEVYELSHGTQTIEQN